MTNNQEKPFSVAIELTGPCGSVTLGGVECRLSCRELPEQRRHNADLMPSIDALCRAHGAAPGDIGYVYVSIGPGSFTGLRIATATAKMLALVTGARVVAVPTLEVVAQNLTAVAHPYPHLAVCLNLKRQQMWTGLFEWQEGAYLLSAPPSLMDMDGVLAQSRRPLAILGPNLPPIPKKMPDVDVLPADLATPHSDVVWKLGRKMARAGSFIDASSLSPLYVRPPEAQELWEVNRAGRRRN